MSLLLRPLFFNLKSKFFDNKFRSFAQCIDPSKKKKPPSPSKRNFIILPDYTRIVDFLWKNCHPEEPTTLGLDLGKGPNPELDEAIIQELSNGLSLQAVDKKNGKVIGCAVNSYNFPNTAAQTLNLSRNIQDQRTSQLFEFYAYIYAIPQLHKKFSVEKVGVISYVTVDKKHREKGIGRTLIKESLFTLHSKGIKVVRLDSTTVKIAKVCKNLGMEKVVEVPFDLYVDKNKKPIMTIKHPDTTIQTFVHVCK